MNFQDGGWCLLLNSSLFYCEAVMGNLNGCEGIMRVYVTGKFRSEDDETDISFDDWYIVSVYF